MPIAQMFADDGPVFGLDQCIVIGMARARLGEFHPQLMEQSCHPLVDVFRTVVGMKASQLKGELFQELFQNGDQVVLADLFHGADDLELSHLVDGVDVVDHFDAI